MRECNATLVEKVAIAKVTKEEDVSSTCGANERIHCIQKEEVAELSLFQKDPDPNSIAYPVEPLPDLNLSLELSRPENTLLDLNLEPLDISDSSVNQITLNDTPKLAYHLSPKSASYEPRNPSPDSAFISFLYFPQALQT